MGTHEKLKIYISADIEGITGVSSWDDAIVGKPDYEHFRKLMAEDVNAAVEAALEFGATEVVVRDAHATARNILPSDLHPKANLIRDWSRGPLRMMEGITKDFDAVFFVGYHAKAGTQNATLNHTITGSVHDLRVNGKSLPEAGWNALIAGYYNVPVVFASGDKALCEQLNQLIEKVITVPVKEGIGEACLTLHPKEAHKRIKEGVIEALTNRDQISPFHLSSPYTVELTFRDESRSYQAKWYPGATLVSDTTVSFTAEDFFDCLRFFCFVV